MSGRVHNVLRNMGFGVLLRLLQTILPFLMRTILIYYLGIQYVGLNSLFSSVLQILNFAELGISSAMNYAMYQPIADGDRGKICALLKEYKKYYFYIGLTILSAGIILIPFLPYIVNKDLPSDVNMYVLYAIHLATNVISYWMFSYRCSLLEAHQRIDIANKINLVLDLLKSILQLIALVVFRNYYLYIVIQLIMQVIYQFVLNHCVNKTYPEYVPQGEISEEDRSVIKQRVKDIVTAKLGGVVLNSSDTVVISAFLGLSVLAIYQNYFFLISTICSFLGICMNGATASIGNSIITDSKEKVYGDFLNILFALSWVICVCTCCFLCLFQPFMEIWVGKEFMLPFSIVLLLCIYFYLHEFNRLFNIYKDAAGLWHEDKLRPLITSLTNLGLNLLMVRYVGLYGVILSTVFSMLFVGMPWLLHNVFTCLFKRSIKDFLKRMLLYVIIVVLSCIGTYYVCSLIQINPLVDLVLKLMIAVSIPSVIYLFVFKKTNEFQKMYDIALRIPKLRKIIKRR